MGMVILPVMFMMAAVWLLIALLCAHRVWVFVRDRTGNGVLAFSLAAAVLPLTWLLPNLHAMLLQWKIDREATDCGWRIVRTVANVQGVYSELNYGDFGRIYQIVQTRARDGSGQIFQCTGSRRGCSASMPVPGRTMRYGFRTLESATAHLRRYEMQVVDFETEEVLARNVHYDLKDSSYPNTVLGLAYYHLSYQPEICRFEKQQPEWDEQIRRVVQPIPVR